MCFDREFYTIAISERKQNHSVIPKQFHEIFKIFSQTTQFVLDLSVQFQKKIKSTLILQQPLSLLRFQLLRLLFLLLTVSVVSGIANGYTKQNSVFIMFEKLKSLCNYILTIKIIFLCGKIYYFGEKIIHEKIGSYFSKKKQKVILLMISIH